MRGKWTLVLVLAAIATLFLITAFKVERSNRFAEVGRPAPDFALPDLDGQRVALSDLKGQVVVINFWATWCPPCKAEMPDFQQLQTEMGDRVRVVSIDWAEPIAKVRAFVGEYGVTFTVLLDQADELSRPYRVTGIPETFFVDKNGILRRQYLGQLTLGQMREFVREAER